jgi:PRTRC genetic system protein A
MIELATSAATPQQRAIMLACPLVCVPPGEAMTPLSEPGRRWVVASGTYLEHRSLALHVCFRVSKLDTTFGTARQFITAINGPVPRELLRQCLDLAMQAGGNETAALIHWNPVARQYELTQPFIESAGEAHVTYRDESQDDLLVYDFHSHGYHPAFFSATDDASDMSRMGPYIAMVAGKCGSLESLETCARMCMSP